MKVSKFRKKTLALALLLPLALAMFHLIETVNAELVAPLIRVGALCAGDEEFMADPANMEAVEDAIEMANNWTDESQTDSFEGTFGVHFEVVDWVSWDSNDSYIFAVEFAAEVLTQTGFETGMIVNNQYCDVLVACTGQDIHEQYAVTFPLANLSLFETDYAKNFGAVRHEFSHLLENGECGSVCVMNVIHCLDPSSPTRGWCNNCESFIHNHKFRYTIVGDVNGDYFVDIRDLGAICKRYGLTRGDENWASSCDINGDDWIDIFDLSAAGSHYGERRY